MGPQWACAHTWRGPSKLYALLALPRSHQRCWTKTHVMCHTYVQACRAHQALPCMYNDTLACTSLTYVLDMSISAYTSHLQESDELPQIYDIYDKQGQKIRYSEDWQEASGLLCRKVIMAHSAAAWGVWNQDWNWISSEGCYAVHMCSHAAKICHLCTMLIVHTLCAELIVIWPAG